MCQENNRRSEAAVCQQSGCWSGASWKAAVALPRAESPEDKCEVAGGRKSRWQAAKGTVCEIAELPAQLREDSPEDRWREAPGGRNLQRQRALGRLRSLGQSAKQ